MKFLLAAMLLAACGAATAADLLLDNVRGYTLERDGELRRFSALRIRDGKVLSWDAAAREGAASIIDGKGRLLLPGFTDAHGHIMSLGFLRSQTDLTGTQSLDEALQRVRDFAKANPKSAWLRGHGWNQEIWKLGRFPTAAELERAVSDRPAWLTRIDGHAGWANALALKRAGVTKNTLDPAGGRIERDASGQPTGVLVDNAMLLVESILPKPSRVESAAALDAALKELASVGLTSVHDAGIDADTLALYQDYAAAGKLTSRIYAMVHGVGADFDRIAKNGPLPDQGLLSVRAVKLVADGALGSRGAAMLEPYSDAPSHRGLAMASEEELAGHIGKAVAKGFQANVHAIGDAGNRAALNAFERVFAKHGGRELRHRVEHAQVVSLSDIPRFKSLGLIASMQPTHATSDMNMAEARVGAERIKGAYAWRRFLEAGVRIAAGSDFPVESPNPFWGLHAAATRQDQRGLPAGGWYPGQKLTVPEAFRAFTLDAAYAARQENELGTLEPGKQADFILIDRDIFSADPQTLWQMQVLETWVAGRRVFRR